MSHRVTLINPPWVVSQNSIWAYVKGTMPPLGLLSIAAVLERAQIDVAVIDLQAVKADWDTYEAMIASAQGSIFGVTATTSIATKAYRVCELIRRHHPDSLVVVGGVHATALPEEPLQLPAVDVVVRGEGEEAMIALARGVPLDQIPGVSYRDGETIRHIGEPGFVADLDSLPIPAYHKVSFENYKPAVGAYKRKPAISMTTTRGCPGQCTFCNSAGIKLRRRSAERVFEEISYLTSTYGIREICFYDDTFTVFPSNILKLCKLLTENRIDITWSCFARVDTVRPDVLAAMKGAGCHQVMFGIEAKNREILEAIKKKVDIARNPAAVRMAKAAGLTTRCSFMLGNPGETEGTIAETIDYAIELDPDIAIFNITVPYPGTEMFEWAHRNDYLLTRDWDRYDLSEQVMRLPTIDNVTLKKKYGEAYRRFYYRPRAILKTARRMADVHEIGNLFEGALSVCRFALGR